MTEDTNPNETDGGEQPPTETEVDADGETDGEPNADVDGETEDDADVLFSTDVDQYRESEMIQYSAVTGKPVQLGYRFSITQPLTQSGTTFEKLQGDTEALLYLGDPDAEQGYLPASITLKEGLPTGHKEDRYRRIYNNGASLQVYLKPDELRAMGIEVEDVNRDMRLDDIETLPVLDVWANEDGIVFRQLDIQEVVVNKQLDRAVEALPKQMMEDYLALEEKGYTARELAEKYAKEMDSPVSTIEWHIERNYEEAQRRIDAYNATQDETNTET